MAAVLLVVLAGVGVVLMLIASRGPAGRPTVTVLDSRLGILWVQVLTNGLMAGEIQFADR
jgi:hypothetical protein